MPAQRFEQRILDIEGAFRRLGQVDVARDEGNPQTVIIAVEHPGWGVDRTARMQFVETWVFDGTGWSLLKYAYDLLLSPGPGRFAYHWHDGLFHTHCVEPGNEGQDHHFGGDEIDIFAAFDHFSAILNGSSPLSCASLPRYGT